MIRILTNLKQSANDHQHNRADKHSRDERESSHFNAHVVTHPLTAYIQIPAIVISPQLQNVIVQRGPNDDAGYVLA